MDKGEILRYDRPMPIGENIQAWRKDRGISTASLASKAGMNLEALEAAESGELDPSASLIEALAQGLGIPAPWIYCDPASFKILFEDSDDQSTDSSALDSPDPIMERILSGTRQDRELYVLVTALLQHGDPKLLRAAGVSLRSLLKQARTATVPWQSRPPGHFEPPND